MLGYKLNTNFVNRTVQVVVAIIFLKVGLALFSGESIIIKKG